MPPEGNVTAKKGNETQPGSELLELGPHWTNLRSQVRDALSLQNEDTDMQDALAIAAPVLANMSQGDDESDEDISVRLTAIFFDRVGSGMRQDGFDAHEAVMYMTEALWDVDTAMNNFLAQQAEDSARESVEQSAVAIGEAIPQESDIEEDLSEEELTVRDLNPNVDREPAIKGWRMPSKFFITLKQPGGKSDKVRTFPRYNGANLDWARSEHIRALNRWRSQVLRRALGEARPARIGFHEEIQWLVDCHRQYKRDSISRIGVVNWQKIKWDVVTRAFNATFAGRALSGSHTPRPARTKPSLITERYRIEAVCVLVGLTLRSSGGNKDVEGGDEEQGGSESDKGEESGPPKKGEKKALDSNDNSAIER